MKARRDDQARNLRKRAELKEATLLGKIMMYFSLAHHQIEMKRKICA